MREILFRGKRIDNGEWVQGFLVIATGGINNGESYILPTVADFSYGDNGNRIRIGCFVEVDPATVGQYTDLTDKNGKKIFEGDIVDGMDFSAEDGYGLVRWDDGAFEVVGGGVCGTFYNNYPGTDFEVINNIHDNPELMEEDDNG